MASNYDLRSSLQTDQQKQDIAFLNKLGVQQTAQNFINAYMSPNELSDLHNRLGTVIASTSDVATVSDYSFPPYNLDITKADLGVRVGGFKSLNDKINQVQAIHRLFSGEIRTKVTEWDLSLYLQEMWIDDLSMFDLSLLYRIFTDNPSGYLDSRALAYGVINAALSYKYKSYAYNPAADPELDQWVSPTSDLSAQLVTPKGHSVTTGGGKWWQFWKHSSTYWVWDVPPPDPINAWQQNQVDIANAAGWTSWTPEFWELFFDSDNPATITADDFPSIIRHLDSLFVARHAPKPAAVPGVKPGSSLFTAPGAPTAQLGLNLKSPFWYGYPYGRYPDSRSVQGYLSSVDHSVPKIDSVPDSTTDINKNYSFGNPTQGIQMLLSGWTSTYPVTTYVQQGLNTYSPSSWVPGASTGNNGFFSLAQVTIPVVYTANTTGYYPTATGVVTVPSSSQRSIIQQVFGFFGESSTTGNPNGRGSTTTPIETWGTQSADQTIDTTMTLQINSFNAAMQSTIDAKLADGQPRPVIIVGAPGKTTNTPAWVLIAPIQKVQAITQSSRTARFLWWHWTVVTTNKTWVYQIDMSKGQGFSIDTGGTAIEVAMPHLPLQYFANGASFQGLYFQLPLRTAGADLKDSGWAGTSIDVVTGQAIATALLNPMWWNGDAYVRAPFRAVLKSVIANVLEPLQPAVDLLSDIFAPSSGPIITGIISKLPDEVQAKQSMQNAVTLFNNTSTGPLLAEVEAAQKNFTNLLSAAKRLLASSTYPWVDMQTFYTLYPLVSGAFLNPKMLGAIKTYLDVLYEQRLALLSARLNKETGTLINVARIEMALALMQDSLVEKPSTVGPLIPSQLRVVHSVTNVSLMDRATKTTDLPTERTRIVYVVVQYTDAGEIIRPIAGEYQLFSKEILAHRSVTPAKWFITFVKDDPNCPNIIKNVVTTLDGNKLQQIMTDTSLTQLEKICYARSLEDWWEIKIPEVSQPLSAFYQNSLQLVLAAPDAFIEQYIKMTGSLSLNPVSESTLALQLGITWAADPDAQTELKSLNEKIT